MGMAMYRWIVVRMVSAPSLSCLVWLLYRVWWVYVGVLGRAVKQVATGRTVVKVTGLNGNPYTLSQ